MKTTTVETSQLSGAALDWAVSAAIGEHDDGDHATMEIGLGRYSPSTNWSQGGPLIDDDYIVEMGEDTSNLDEPFYAEGRTHEAETGETYLIAVCRVIVAAALGDEVDVPSELVEASDA